MEISVEDGAWHNIPSKATRKNKGKGKASVVSSNNQAAPSTGVSYESTAFSRLQDHEEAVAAKVAAKGSKPSVSFGGMSVAVAEPKAPKIKAAPVAEPLEKVLEHVTVEKLRKALMTEENKVSVLAGWTRLLVLDTSIHHVCSSAHIIAKDRDWEVDLTKKLDKSVQTFLASAARIPESELNDIVKPLLQKLITADPSATTGVDVSARLLLVYLCRAHSSLLSRLAPHFSTWFPSFETRVPVSRALLWLVRQSAISFPADALAFFWTTVAPGVASKQPSHKFITDAADTFNRVAQQLSSSLSSSPTTAPAVIKRVVRPDHLADLLTHLPANADVTPAVMTYASLTAKHGGADATKLLFRALLPAATSSVAACAGLEQIFRDAPNVVIGALEASAEIPAQLPGAAAFAKYVDAQADAPVAAVKARRALRDRVEEIAAKKAGRKGGVSNDVLAAIRNEAPVVKGKGGAVAVAGEGRTKKRATRAQVVYKTFVALLELVMVLGGIMWIMARAKQSDGSATASWVGADKQPFTSLW